MPVNFKRIVDIGLVLAVAPIALPVVSWVAVAIAATSRGNPFFLQERVGRGGRRFKLIKLRSMYNNADQIKNQVKSDLENSITFKCKADPRITPVGKILRKTSLDELPQLWNVFKGDMSVVGPRPALPSEVERYSEHHRKRLEAEQGLTGLAQIMGRSDLPFEKQVELDIKYVMNKSAWKDIEIIAKTIPSVLLGKGAY